MWKQWDRCPCEHSAISDALTTRFSAKQMTSNGNLIFLSSQSQGERDTATRQTGTPTFSVNSWISSGRNENSKVSSSSPWSPALSEFIHCHHEAENSPLPTPDFGMENSSVTEQGPGVQDLFVSGAPEGFSMVYSLSLWRQT